MEESRANHTVTFLDGGKKLEVVKFEENRFFPVHYANLKCKDGTKENFDCVKVIEEHIVNYFKCNLHIKE